ncbi:hypothetical protein [Providencia phage PSTNGR1]|uniref:Peptidase S74 domain-containing protein n=1 Tax=Providencia phage PSTNGR1 TaxID=2783542 RepID=A0A873WMT7_9CAUD|nr:hypothetical protein [Providencia phage PSTNGR1]
MADAPYLSMQRFNGNGTTTDWTVNFAGGTPPYLDASDVIAYEIIPATALTAEVRIDRTVTYIGPSQFRVTPAVASGRILVLRRKTEDQFNLVDFQSLQAVSEYDLDLANKQLLFLSQEAVDQARLAEERSVVAETIAYTSVNDASEALTTANSANSKATTALSTANAAFNAADDAVNTADAANSTANSANSIANTALSTANSATATANTALSTANAADTKANTAIATANGAVDTAVAAAADASAALTASEQAELAAAAAQSSAAATELLAASADANAATALSTANGIDAKATEALDTANAASATATEAMTLIEEAGVSTFNGRAGVVMPLAGDYSAAQVTFNGVTVADALDDLADYDAVLTAELQSEIARVEQQTLDNMTSALATKLDTNGIAVDSQKLGGQVSSYYATSSALTTGLNSKLNANAKATSAATADQLTTARTINGVSFNGTANIVVADATKLPLTGGVVTGEIQLRGTATNWVGIDMDPSRAYSLRIHSPGIAYTHIGARNGSYTHYESGTGNHYFYGNIIAQSNITAYSDIRVKTNLELIRNPLDKLSRMGGYTYDRTDVEGPRQAGVIAQQVLEVLPEAVTVDPESGHYFVNYNSVIGLLVEAVNALNDKVKELENGTTK